MPRDDDASTLSDPNPGDQKKKRAKDRVSSMRRRYGAEFPNLEALEREKSALAKGKTWLRWVNARLSEQRNDVSDRRLHYARHRLMRQGLQWISTRDGRKWRELEESKNRIRAVFNMIGPALDFRLSLLREQAPGWKYEPHGGGVAGRESAEAQQSVVEYTFKTQKIWRLMQHAQSHAQTDGVSWLEVFIDKSRGPQLERVATVARSDSRHAGLKAAGYKARSDGALRVPLGDRGDTLPAGSKPSRFSSGEVSTRLLSAHETYTDPEALSINGPDQRAKWFIVRRPRDLTMARLETGNDKLEALSDSVNVDLLELSLDSIQSSFRGIPPYPQQGTMKGSSHGSGRGVELVWDYTLYFAGDPKGVGSKGMRVRILGDTFMESGTLPEGRIPVARMTDGSSDVAMYPRPVMYDWVGDQLSINALGSKILEYARSHPGSRLLALQGTQISETWTNIVGSIVEYMGPKPDIMPALASSTDTWKMFTTAVSMLEDKTGWTDLARGKVAGASSNFEDISGRAILGAREMFERQFGPMIRATADTMTDWADLVVVYSRFLYKVPRLIPMATRPDLAKNIDSKILGDQSVVYVDPETLMPLPRALRNQMLWDHFKEGLIDAREYQKRSPFAEIRTLGMGDTDQWDRAQWINTVLEENYEDFVDIDPLELYSPESGILIFWQDDPKVHMLALDEIILDERQVWDLRKVAADRWGIYAELDRSKNHPQELEIQGVPRPPAPIETMGVPNDVPQRSATLLQQTTGGNGVPGAEGQPGVLSAPETAPIALPEGASDVAQPLGEFGLET